MTTWGHHAERIVNARGGMTGITPELSRLVQSPAATADTKVLYVSRHICSCYWCLPPPRRLCFHRRLFVCLHDYAQTTQPLFTKFDGIVAHGPWEKRLDFDGWLMVVIDRLFQLGLELQLGEGRVIPLYCSNFADYGYESTRLWVWFSRVVDWIKGTVGRWRRYAPFWCVSAVVRCTSLQLYCIIHTLLTRRGAARRGRWSALSSLSSVNAQQTAVAVAAAALLKSMQAA